jgi:hypothetical protein
MRPADSTTTVKAWNLTPAEEQALHASDATVSWLCNLPVEVLRQYAGRWVAARDSRILAAGDTYEALLAALGGADLQSVVIHRIERAARVIYELS